MKRFFIFLQKRKDEGLAVLNVVMQEESLQTDCAYIHNYGHSNFAEQNVNSFCIAKATLLSSAKNITTFHFIILDDSRSPRLTISYAKDDLDNLSVIPQYNMFESKSKNSWKLITWNVQTDQSVQLQRLIQVNAA